MRQSRRLLTTIAFVCAAAVSPAGSANLITNGDFESQLIGGVNAGSGFEYVTSLAGWTVTDATSPLRGAVLFNSAYGQPLGGGAQSLQLEDDLDAISQTIATVVGQLYELSFDLSAYSSPGASAVTVGIGGGSFSFGGTAAGYVTHTQLFTATSASTLISFTSNVSGGVRYPHLDNVSVEAVPAPAPLALLAIGLLGAGSARRR